MADVSLTIRALGLQDVQAGFDNVRTSAQRMGAEMQQVSRDQQAAAVQTQAAVQRTAQVHQQSAAQIQRSSMTSAQRFRELGQALAGVSAIASILARNNPELQRQLEVLSLTLSSMGTAARALGAALRFVIGIVGIKIVIIGSLIAAIVFLIRNWEQARAAAVRIWGEIASFFRRVFSAIGTAAGGLGQILLGALTFNMDRIQAGWAQLTGGLRQLGGLAMEVGRGVVSLAQAGWDRLQRFFGTTATSASRMGRAFRETKKDIQEFVAATEEAVARAAAFASLSAGQGVLRAGLAAQFAAQRFGERQDMNQVLAGQAAQIRNALVTQPGSPEAEKAADPLREQVELARARLELEQARLAVGASTAQKVEEERQSLIGALQALAAANITEVEKLRIRTEIVNLLGREHALGIQVGENIQEQVEIARAQLALEEERLRVGVGSLEAVKAAREELIRMLQAYAAIADAATKLRIELEIIRLQSGEAGKALESTTSRMQTVMEDMRAAWEGFFHGLISGTQNVGDALVNLWRGIVDAISRQLSQLAANSVMQMLFGQGFASGDATGGLFGGLINSVRGIFGGRFARGGEFTVTRPTLFTAGEHGAERVNVRPMAGPDSGSPQTVVREAAPAQPVHITIQALDPMTFQHWAQRNASVFHDMLLAGMRQNNKVGKLLGGAQVP